MLLQGLGVIGISSILIYTLYRKKIWFTAKPATAVNRRERRVVRASSVVDRGACANLRANVGRQRACFGKNAPEECKFEG
jgi:hypothetical protein